MAMNPSRLLGSSMGGGRFESLRRILLGGAFLPCLIAAAVAQSPPNFTRRLPAGVSSPNQTSSHARTTPDGKFVVFSSSATNLGITTNGSRQIYLWERSETVGSSNGTLTLVSRRSGDTGNVAEADCFCPFVSDDGKQIVFETTAQLDPTNDSQAGTNDWDIYVRDLTVSPAQTRLISKNANGLAGNGPSRFPCLSGDGTTVVFTSSASDLIANDNNSRDDVFRVGVTGSPQMAAMSVDNSGALSNAHCRTTDPNLDALSVGHVVNDTGTLVLLQGNPTNWNFYARPPASGGAEIQLIFLRDLRDTQNPHTFLVSRKDDGNHADEAANRDSRRACISADGSQMAFSTLATNLDSDGTLSGTIEDIFRVDLATVADEVGVVVPIKVRGDLGAIPNWLTYLPKISKDGRFCAFASDASNLLANGTDSNGLRDIFVVEFGTNPPSTEILRRFNVTSAGAQATGGATHNPDIGGNGTVIVYQSFATNLVASDTSGFLDVFESLSPGEFKRGDADNSNTVDGTDPTFLNNWLFLSSGLAPPCLDAGDADDSGEIDNSDGTFINNFLFLGGSAPPTPGPNNCGDEPGTSAEGLTCAIHMCQ